MGFELIHSLGIPVSKKKKKKKTVSVIHDLRLNMFPVAFWITLVVFAQGARQK